MAERLLAMSEPELEQALLNLGGQLDYPPTPDLAAGVRRTLVERTNRPTPFWAAFVPLQRRVALALAALLLLGGAILALSPQARTAVAERLGLRGVEIRQVPTAPTAGPAVPLPSPASLGSRLNLGQALTLDQARTRVAYPLVLPTALGAPDEAYLLETPPGGQLALVYHARSDLPQASATGIGVLLTEFQGDIHSTGAIVKGLPPGTRLEDVQVSGNRGYWIEGDPHTFFYLDAQGRMQTESTRLAGNVLLWEHGRLTLRLESALRRDQALSIAASVQE